MIPDYSVCWLLSCFRFKAPRLGQFVPAAPGSECTHVHVNTLRRCGDAEEQRDSPHPWLVRRGPQRGRDLGLNLKGGGETRGRAGGAEGVEFFRGPAQNSLGADR